jgi:hypothetical protein
MFIQRRVGYKYSILGVPICGAILAGQKMVVIVYQNIILITRILLTVLLLKTLNHILEDLGLVPKALALWYNYHNIRVYKG